MSDFPLSVRLATACKRAHTVAELDDAVKPLVPEINALPEDEKKGLRKIYENKRKKLGG